MHAAYILLCFCQPPRFHGSSVIPSLLPPYLSSLLLQLADGRRTNRSTLYHQESNMGETPPAEIAKQHKEACRLVDSQMPCAPRVNHGEVPEEWKLKPTCPLTASTTPPINPNSQDEVEVPNNNKYIDWCISSRGQVDVSPIVKLISEGVNEPAPLPPTNENDKPKNGTKTKPAKKLFGVTVNNNTKATKPISSANLWNEQNAAKYNVKITRPSHDRWGIKKIVLMFCDDFLHTTYTLPWYQEGNKTGKQMHAALQPILDCLGIQKSQLVRCLLAGLPPGVTIPVHHDTGKSLIVFIYRVIASLKYLQYSSLQVNGFGIHIASMCQSLSLIRQRFCFDVDLLNNHWKE